MALSEVRSTRSSDIAEQDRTCLGAGWDAITASTVLCLWSDLVCRRVVVVNWEKRNDGASRLKQQDILLLGFARKTSYYIYKSFCKICGKSFLLFFLGK